LFLVIYLKSGYHQVGVKESSIRYTSFVTPQGQFEHMRMPFGLRNGPSVFQRFISNSLINLVRNRKIVVYMDDIVVVTRTVEENFEILVQLLERLAKLHLEINFKNF